MHTITVIPVPAVGAGFQPDDPHQAEYLQFFWCPILGPPTVLLLCELHRRTGGQHTVQVGLDDLGLDLGLGRSGGYHSRINHTLRRAEHFRFLTRSDPDSDRWGLRSLVPELSGRLLNQLRPELIIEERAFLARYRPVGEAAA